MQKKRGDITRRTFGLGIAGAAGCATAGPVPASGTNETMRIDGHVRWCNRPRGLLMFRPARPDASDMLIYLALKAEHLDDDADKRLKTHLRPGAAVAVVLSWRPDLDVLAPWQPREVVAVGGERLEAVSNPAIEEARLPARKRQAAEQQRRDAEQKRTRSYSDAMAERWSRIAGA